MERGVRLVFESGRPIAHVAADLGVGAETLRKRVRQAESDSGKRTEGKKVALVLIGFALIFQDLALVLADDVSSEQVRRVILRAGRPLAVEASLFDVYRGERIGADKRSLAYRITYQSPERTLTDREVAEAHGRIEAALERELGAQVRGR